MQPVANVGILTTPDTMVEDARRLMRLVQSTGIKPWPRNEDIEDEVDTTGIPSGDGVLIEAFYHPAPEDGWCGRAMLYVTGLDDALLARGGGEA